MSKSATYRRICSIYTDTFVDVVRDWLFENTKRGDWYYVVKPHSMTDVWFCVELIENNDFRTLFHLTFSDIIDDVKSTSCEDWIVNHPHLHKKR